MSLSRLEIEMELNLILGSAFHIEREKLLTHDAEQRAEIERLKEQLRLTNIDQVNAETYLFDARQALLTEGQRAGQLQADLDSANRTLEALRTTQSAEFAQCNADLAAEHKERVHFQKGYQGQLKLIAKLKEELAACRAELEEARQYDVRTLPIAESGTGGVPAIMNRP